MDFVYIIINHIKSFNLFKKRKYDYLDSSFTCSMIKLLGMPSAKRQVLFGNLS